MKKILFLATTTIISFTSFSSIAEHHEKENDGKGRDKGMYFEKKDTDNDGFLSKEEFMNMERQHKDGKSYMMKGVDKNDDGEISKSEFLGAKEEKFKKMDSDNNGNLTKEEIKSYHETKKEEHEDRKEERAEKKEERMENREEKFKAIDTNNDGKISKEEMMEYHKSHKDKMGDKNKDKKSDTPPSSDE